MKTKIFLLRHGETEKNVKGLLHSSNDLETLNENGIKQIERTAQKLLKEKVDIIYHSKKNRTKQSAEIIAKVCGCEIKSLTGLRERDWGIYSDQPWKNVKEILEKMNLEERYNFTPKNGESWKNFEKRLINTLKKILSENENKNIGIVSHGGSIRALIPYLLNLPKEESFKFDPDNASITIFEFDGKNFKKIEINNSSHLH